MVGISRSSHQSEILTLASRSAAASSNFKVLTYLLSTFVCSFFTNSNAIKNITRLYWFNWIEVNKIEIPRPHKTATFKVHNCVQLRCCIFLLTDMVHMLLTQIQASYKKNLTELDGGTVWLVYPAALPPRYVEPLISSHMGSWLSAWATVRPRCSRVRCDCSYYCICRHGTFQYHSCSRMLSCHLWSGLWMAGEIEMESAKGPASLRMHLIDALALLPRWRNGHIPSWDFLATMMYGCVPWLNF